MRATPPSPRLPTTRRRAFRGIAQGLRGLALDQQLVEVLDPELAGNDALVAAVLAQPRDLERPDRMQAQHVPVRAEIVADVEFSVHADAYVLVAWLHEMPERPETVDVA